MAHAAQQGKLVGRVGQFRQVFAQLQPRHASGNGLEFAPVLDGRLGLGIEAVEVARAAREIDKDGRGGLGRA
jgi:hypothetical protein